MKKFILFLSLTIAFAGLLNSFGVARTIDTNKILNFIVKNKLVQGDDNGDLMLEQNLTREQMVVLMSRLLEKEEQALTYPLENMKFTDVPENSWAKHYIAWAYDKGLIRGYDEQTFGYGDNLTVWQTKAFMIRALGYIDMSDEEIIQNAEKLGISFNYEGVDGSEITRQDMIILLYNTLYAPSTLVDNMGVLLGERLGLLEQSNKKTIRYGNTLYFINQEDNKLYRTMLGTNLNLKLSDDTMTSISVSDDWIYYINTSDQDKIYKVKTQGTSRTKLNNDSVLEMIVSDGSIYYVSKSDNKLYMLNVEGTKVVKLNDNHCKNISLIEDKIYYLNNSDGDKLYSVNTNGTSNQKVYYNKFENTIENEKIDDYAVLGDLIYYSNKFDGNKLYKINIDGTQKTKLTQNHAANIFATNGYVYYNNLSSKVTEMEDGSIEEDDAYQIYRININTLDKEEILKNPSQLLYVDSNWIYYKSIIQGNKLFKAKKDGTNEIKLSDTRVGDITVTNNYIYYTDENLQGNLFRMNIDGKDIVQINQNKSYGLFVNDGWIYYSNVSDGYKIYKTKIETIETQQITHSGGLITEIDSEYIKYLSLIDNEIYVIKNDGTSRTE